MLGNVRVWSKISFALCLLNCSHSISNFLWLKGTTSFQDRGKAGDAAGGNWLQIRTSHLRAEMDLPLLLPQQKKRNTICITVVDLGLEDTGWK